MLVEIRIGPGRWKLKNIMAQAGAECKVRTQKVPHLTLYGPYKANQVQIKKVKRTIESLCSNHSHLSFMVDDYEFKKRANGRGWIFAFKIRPSEDREKLRNKLSEELSEITPSPQPWDNRASPFWFHISLALNIGRTDAEKLWTFLHKNDNCSVIERSLGFIDLKKTGQKRFCLPMDGLRITLLNEKRRIICEYDLPQKRWLTREAALDRDRWKRTLKAFRLKSGIEGYTDKATAEATYVISDLHLDHTNIIRYCARPFSFLDVNEMNEVLVKNWNNTVKKDDTVYYRRFGLRKRLTFNRTLA